MHVNYMRLQLHHDVFTHVHVVLPPYSPLLPMSFLFHFLPNCFLFCNSVSLNVFEHCERFWTSAKLRMLQWIPVNYYPVKIHCYFCNSTTPPPTRLLQKKKDLLQTFCNPSCKNISTTREGDRAFLKYKCRTTFLKMINKNLSVSLQIQVLCIWLALQ